MLNLFNVIPSNDNNIINPCVACGESAACRDGLCAKCDHDVAVHCEAADFWPYDAIDMDAARYFPGKF